MVGPDFQRPETTLPQQWHEAESLKGQKDTIDFRQWWRVFNDPVLDSLIETAIEQNLNLEQAGLRVLEARAQLGLAAGTLFPQSQKVRAGGTRTHLSKHGANTMAADLSYTDYSAGFDAAWELDLWGGLRRGVQAADAALLASIADYDDVMVSLTAEVARTYVLIRTLEHRISLASENVQIQQRSLQIAQAQLDGGIVTELDIQQARALLRDTQALIPRLETGLLQARHGLSVLLGRPPGDLEKILGEPHGVPMAAAQVAVGVPAELLRRRPDIRRAEFLAAGQSALIGVAKADLYPHFSLTGSIGLRAGSASFTKAGGAGGSSLGDLFDSDSLEFFTGPSLSWDLLNYGRIKNRVRVQDARFQQLVIQYRNTVLNAAREVEDAMVGFLRAQNEKQLLSDSVSASKRAVDLSLLQYGEGLVDYQRVLDAERFLTQQQDLLTATEGAVALNLISMYKALGGGWQTREGKDFVSEKNREAMRNRTDWGTLLD